MKKFFLMLLITLITVGGFFYLSIKEETIDIQTITAKEKGGYKTQVFSAKKTDNAKTGIVRIHQKFY